MEVVLHPLFESWFTSLTNGSLAGGTDWWEVAAEIAALLGALESHGRNLGDPECHEVVSARYDIRALRRTPPTETTPYADGPPVIRVLVGFVRNEEGQTKAVALLGGDKTALGNSWYPANVEQAQQRLDQWCSQNSGFTPIIRRGGN
ncbi:MAG: hypothetical protein OXH86_06020 [Acidimicrobiaceae bacterium]|nr:hypothetical protein [Acidimicrobiaceae bacterium]MDE0496889.1 hypothetical protein [Acidimicrobiaceae bacterium]